MLQHLTQQFDHGQDESRKTLLDTLRIGVDAIRERARNRSELRREISTHCIVDIDGRLALVSASPAKRIWCERPEHR